MGGVNASFANNQLIARQIKMLENKLDKALIKFNETLARNKVLRNSIDDARRERVVFDGIYKKLERELHEKKKEMARIIEESKNAYKVRDKAQSEIHALRQHAEKERGDFELEFKELGDLVNQQQQMLEQIRLKQLEAPQDEHSLGSLSTDAQQEELQVKSTALYTSKDKAQLELSHEQLQSYEQALQQIQLTTGMC
jgi:chromosome segregation ATPase